MVASGTQSIQRAALILRLIGDHHREGLRLVDLAEQLDIERPTIHRIVKSLMAENLVSQERASRRYHLGQGVVALGFAVTRTFNFRETAQPILEGLAARTGDTYYLNQRIGNEALCLVRTDGVCPIKVYSVGVGDRRPLGVGAGGLAILAAMPVPECEAVLHANEGAMSRYKGLNMRALRGMLDRTRRQGYAHMDVYGFAGVQAIGVPVMSPQAGPVAALSVASIASRFGTKRVEELVEMLKDQARALERLTADFHW